MPPPYGARPHLVKSNQYEYDQLTARHKRYSTNGGVFCFWTLIFCLLLPVVIWFWWNALNSPLPQLSPEDYRRSGIYWDHPRPADCQAEYNFRKPPTSNDKSQC